MKTFEKRAFESRFEDIGDGMTVIGYASVFERFSEFMGYKEIIHKGAFDGCDMDDVLMTCEHNMSQPLARTLNKTLSLTVDEIGLRYKGEMADVTYARDVKEWLKRKDITKSSFGFWVDEEEWTYDGPVAIRNIYKFKKLRDVGPVINPAYQDTSADIRSLIPPAPTKIFTGMSLELVKNTLTINSHSFSL